MRQAKFEVSPIFKHFREWWEKQYGADYDNYDNLLNAKYDAAWAAWKEASSNERRLQDAVVLFRNKHDITCPEAIYQVDNIIEDGYALIERLVTLIGYLPLEEQCALVTPPSTNV